MHVAAVLLAAFLAMPGAKVIPSEQKGALTILADGDIGSMRIPAVRRAKSIPMEAHRDPVLHEGKDMRRLRGEDKSTVAVLSDGNIKGAFNMPAAGRAKNNAGNSTTLLEDRAACEEPPSATVFCNPEQRQSAMYWVVTNPMCNFQDGLAGLEAWSKGWAGSVFALTGSPSYEDPIVHTMDGVMVQDAEFCTVAGLVDTPSNSALLYNSYTAVRERVAEICSADAVKSALNSSTPEELKAAEGDYGALLKSERTRPVLERQGFMREYLFSRQVANLCQMDYMACMVHACSFSYCKMCDGRIGMGCQCRSDWNLNQIPEA